MPIKEAAYEWMATAYMKASAGNTLPANARQIMYALRPYVLEATGGKCWSDSSYFTQTLLPDFMNACGGNGGSGGSYIGGGGGGGRIAVYYEDGSGFRPPDPRKIGKPE